MKARPDARSGDTANAAHPVGRKNPNSWGIYDMHGNVWKWCYDAVAPYQKQAAVDPTFPNPRMIRQQNAASPGRGLVRFIFDGDQL